MTLKNTVYAPQYTANGYVGLTGSQLQASGLGDDWEFGGSFSKILGRHTIKAGADFETNNFTSPIAYSNIGFASMQTAGVGANQGVGGNSWASLLLGVPSSAGYRNIHEVVTDGWIDGIYVQDQFKATRRFTINLGFRNDMVFTPIYGTGKGTTTTRARPTPSPANTSSTRFLPIARRPRARPAFRPATTPHPARLLRAGFPHTLLSAQLFA